MSGVGVRVSREGPGLALPASLSGTVGSATGDDIDWVDGGGAPGSITGSGEFELKNDGGQDIIKAHGSLGAAATFEPADGNVHSGTLNANCTFTLSSPSGTGACSLEFWLTQDGTGGWVITWPVSVTVIGTPATTVSTTSRVVVETINAGTSWLATWIEDTSASGSSLTVKDEGSSLATAATSLDFVGAGVTASGTGAGKTITIPGGTGIVVKDEGSTLATSADTLDFVGAGVVASGTGTTKTITIAGSTGGVATAKDTLVALYGSPATAYDFDTNSLVGLTALGTPSTENANTTIPDCYFARQNATASYSLVGRYQAIPAYPWTAIAVLLSASPQLDYNVAGLWIGVSSPGNMDYLHWGRALYQTALERVSPTAFSSTIVTARLNGTDTPMFFAIRANSTTSFDYMTSHDGRVWTLLQATRNPGITVANIGIAIKAENASSSMSAAFDLFYLYTSALTMAGA